MKILFRRDTETMRYAVDELIKYVRLITNCEIMPEAETTPVLSKNAPENTVVLGLLGELSLDTSDLDDDFVDDIIDIDIKNGSGYIAGSNERSVLMGVYKYCTSAGCRFIRPGENGEYIPYCDLSNHSYKYRKKADYPFRGECCEGAISYEHMRDTVYWLPKVGMNVYMIEGIVPYTYMHKWYAHIGNRVLHPKAYVTDSQMLEDYIAKLEMDIKKTGLQFHAMGHGWMFEKMGVHDRTPDEEAKAIANLTEEQKKYFAEVKGVRGIYHGSSFYTHFCYSNPEARKLLVDFCVEYIQKKPYIDFLHVWLADSKNNQCECPECVQKTPSDWYVILLNEIDAALEAIGSKSRLVFIMYVDTVRPPEIEKLNNPKRFTILTAIGMPYETGYKVEEYKGEIPPFVRNNFIPESTPLRMLYHKKWKEWCDNIPSFIFEYRFYTDMYCDPGYMRVSRETHRDMRSLTEVSVQGCINDQTHRMYMPTSLPLLLMGETLFDRDLDFEAYTNDYFDAAFGNDAKKVREYLETLSDLFCPKNIRITGGNGVEDQGVETQQDPETAPLIGNPKVAEKTAKIPAVLDEFLPTIEKNMTLENAAQRLSWIYLKYHSKICAYLAKIYNLAAKNEIEDAKAVLEELEIYLSKVEIEIHNAFDLFLFVKTVRAKLGLKMVKYYE